MKRKALALVLTAAMAATALAGCGSSADTGSASTTSAASKDDTAAADTEEDGDYYVDEDGNKYKKFDDVQLKMLVCWNGGFNTADDQYNNEVAAAIRDKIGVTVEFEGIMMSEDEKLNMMFRFRRYARYDQCTLLGRQLRFDWDHQKRLAQKVV